MEILGVDVALVTAMSIIVLGIVEWFKNPTMPTWAIRILVFVVAYAIVALVTLGEPFVWQVFIKTGAAAGFMASGIWHGATRVGTAISKKQ